MAVEITRFRVAAAVGIVAVVASVIVVRADSKADKVRVTASGASDGAARSAARGDVDAATLVIPASTPRGRLALQVVDLQRMEVGSAPISPLTAAATWSPFLRGTAVVVVDIVDGPPNSRAAWVFDEPSAEPRPLSGPHLGLEAFPSAVPDRLWLAAVDHAGEAGRVWEVDMAGRVWTARAGFEADRRPIAALSNGLVREIRTEDYGVGLEVWDPVTGAVVTTVAERDALFLDASGTMVAWLSGTDGLHITDAATGVDQVVPRPSRDVAFSTMARFSPDRSRLAVDVVDAVAVGGPIPALERFAGDVPLPGVVAVVHVATAAASVIPGSRTAGDTWRSDVAWSPGGETLFLGRALLGRHLEASEFSVLAHRSGDGTTVRLPLTLRHGPLLVP